MSVFFNPIHANNQLRARRNKSGNLSNDRNPYHKESIFEKPYNRGRYANENINQNVTDRKNKE